MRGNMPKRGKGETMQDTSSKALVTLGRILLALYFLVPGIAKLAAPDMQLAMMEHHNIPAALPLLYIAGAAQVLGALLLLMGHHVRSVCLGFVLYILVINYALHDFWHFEGIEAAHELQNFLKNMGILAGLLIFAGLSPRRKLSLKGILAAD